MTLRAGKTTGGQDHCVRHILACSAVCLGLRDGTESPSISGEATGARAAPQPCRSASKKGLRYPCGAIDSAFSAAPTPSCFSSTAHEADMMGL